MPTATLLLTSLLPDLTIPFSLANRDTITRHAAFSIATKDSQASNNGSDLIDGECWASTSRWARYSKPVLSVQSPLSLLSPFASG